MINTGRAFSANWFAIAIFVVFITYHPWFLSAQSQDSVVSKNNEVAWLHQQFINTKDDAKLSLRATNRSLNYALSAELPYKITVRYSDAGYTQVEQELKLNEDILKNRKLYVIILLVLLFISITLAAWAYKLMKLRERSLKEISRINEDKNHFIGVVSHDLRSPLNSIMALSSLINDDPKGATTEEIKEFSSIILNSSKRMETLINNMLDVNKIETGNTKLELVPTSISGIIAEIAESMSHLGNEKDITTEIKIEDELPMVVADGTAVARILENLISNAYKFSPKQSTVSIFATSEGNQVQIAIKDQGHGMTELDRNKLFQKFEKLSASPTGNEKSTGLGLYIVKNLMTEMNGTILVESELAMGTTFTVLFNKV